MAAIANLLDSDVFDRTLARIRALTADSAPLWGRMNAGQMLAHCAEIVEVTNGKPLENTPWYLRPMGPLIRMGVLSAWPYPKSAPTHPQYVFEGSAAFEEERERLIRAMDAFQEAADAPVRHPMFGRLTPEQKGRSTYKHLDHHLRQFGL